MSDSDADYDSKAQFIKAVRDEGAVLGGVEYFTEGEGKSTSYHARLDDGEVVDLTKADVEDEWEMAQRRDASADDDDASEDEGPQEVHLGTFYFSQANWDEDTDRNTLEELLDEVGWYIDGEVASGGYRIKSER